MREILFRGKSNYGNVGEWECGLVAQPHVTEDGIVTSYYFTKLCKDGYSSQRTVSANTIGQYTGLTDKNGKKIFEGDIVKVDGFVLTVNGIYEVIYDEVNHCYALERDIKYHFHYFTFSDLNGFQETSEVIGNIHDNPELLEGGAE